MAIGATVAKRSGKHRILGAWIGNMVPYTTPWPAVLQKIQNDGCPRSRDGGQPYFPTEVLVRRIRNLRAISLS
jgi:hypothetical protein